MNEQELLKRLRSLTVWQRFGERAPHKPLLLLYALGRLLNHAERLVSYTDVKSDLTNLLKLVGPPRKSYHPAEPFKRLPGDGLWELDLPRELSGRPLPTLYESELLSYNIAGGFSHEIYEFLMERTDLIQSVACRLLTENFPVSYHDEIRRCVGLLESEVVPVTREQAKRDPRFRDDVLRAYGRSCSVCGSDLRLADALFDLEAAHIMWHSAEGPDEVPNGLALCGFHHKAFDRGAWGLRQRDSGFTIQVSSDLNGSSQAVDLLLDFEGEKLRLPRKCEHFPDPRYVEWHTKQVFRDAR
ncbi:MAG: HNH endonuclease [Gammaproteobacteria bacterium]|nr:HNH endonuclease [Gammaproteobacteria bacterium]